LNQLIQFYSNGITQQIFAT